MKIFITGSAGFIGFNLAKICAKIKNTLVGIDNFDNYYDLRLKKEK